MWRTYYVGGLTIDGSTDTEWSAAPDEGVLAVKTWNDDDRRYSKILTGDRWYFILGGIIASDTTKDLDELFARYPQAHGPKRGKWVQDSEMEAVRQAALKARHPLDG